MRLLQFSISSCAFVLALSACQPDESSTLNSVDLSCAAAAFSTAEASSCANAITAQMTIEQKIGQMIQGEIRDVTPEDVRFMVWVAYSTEEVHFPRRINTPR